MLEPPAYTPVLVLDSTACARGDGSDELERALHVGIPLAAPDVVFHRELSGRKGELLARRGLRVEPLRDLVPAIALRRENPGVSFGDALALFLAASHGWALLAASPSLALLAERRGVAVRPTEWLSREIERRLARASGSPLAPRTPQVGCPRAAYAPR
jgi:hypothetical protein